VQLRSKIETPLRLLLTAERLFAEEGVDTVTVRRISQAADQRNNSVLQYHFGSKDALIEAILDYRMTPMNARRLESLEEAERRGERWSVRRIVESIVLPYSDLLKGPASDSYYLSLIAQLYSHQRTEVLIGAGYARTRSLQQCFTLLNEALAHLPKVEREQRLRLMGHTLVHALAQWAHERRQARSAWSDADVQPRASALIAFIVGGLTARSSARNRRRGPRRR
jgi:AcrR family transcriptional regulator